MNTFIDCELRDFDK